MAVAFCPECGEGIRLGSQPHEGQRVTCAECSASLEVISVRPLELDWAYDEPIEDLEEWDMEWDFDEEWEEDWGPEEGWEEDLDLEEPENIETEWKEY